MKKNMDFNMKKNMDFNANYMGIIPYQNRWTNLCELRHLSGQGDVEATKAIETYTKEVRANSEKPAVVPPWVTDLDERALEESDIKNGRTFHPIPLRSENMTDKDYYALCAHEFAKNNKETKPHEEIEPSIATGIRYKLAPNNDAKN